MTRHLFTMIAAAALLAACGSDGTEGSSSSSSSGQGGGATTSTADATSSTSGTGGSGGASNVCGDGAIGDDELCDDGNTTAGDGCQSGCKVELGYTCSGEPSVCVTTCGDGNVAGDEACDDGNLDAGDGCDAACTIEAGFTCIATPSVCTETCGDGLVVGIETCDDGGADPGDGCDDLCETETGYDCAGEPSVCDTVCGDGVIAGLEACDDGDAAPGNGCDDLCAIETGWLCVGEPSVCDTTCGDGITAGAETCDDGNASAADGCDAACLVEAGFNCTGAPSACVTTCGDGVIAGAEICDDGNASGADGCGATCLVETGFTCAGMPSACATTCGDSIIAGTETCDDGGAIALDGCDASCLTEAGFTCVGAPSVCTTTCGDGVQAGFEACDDGNIVDNDGCASLCSVEVGFSCMGTTPTVCTSICGDGNVVGTETCDDGATAVGDGCNATCQTETGWACAGIPSNCSPICGDGMQIGGEACDDGNTTDGDGCSAACTLPDGDSCLNPLTTAQAIAVGSGYQWDIGTAGVTTIDDAWGCDPNGTGPDVVVKYTKTSGTLAQGGLLLYALATTGASTSTANYLNMQIVSAGCDSTVGTINTCLWYKHDWASFLDVPAGDYFIWVSKNSTGTFPATTLTVDEVPASAGEGEGCYAPYTMASSIYTPPAGPGAPHTWTIPASINSFDMGVTWGGPGSMSCDNNVTYGDIEGVDAVIEFPKSSASSVLQVLVDNLDPSITTSDLDVEILANCDPTGPNTSFACAANLDTIQLTGGGAQGNVYVWVSTEATSEEFDGASVQISELFPGIGESRFTPEPLTGSGPITPTSTFSLDRPSCFTVGPNIHWYSYTTMNEVFSVGGNASGRLAVLDPAGNELGCSLDALATPFATVGTAGATYLVAVETVTPITSLTISDSSYSGVGTTLTDMNITGLSTTDYELTVSGTQIFLLGTSIYAAPKAGNAAAAVYDAAQGITSTQLGYDGVFANGSLFTIDTTTSTSANRLFKVYDEPTDVWGPTSWDLTPSYVSAGSYTVTFDGVNLIHATYQSSTTTGTASFYSVSPNAPSTPVFLGTNPNLFYVTGIAADASYIYAAARNQANDMYGLYRVDRANITGPILPLYTTTSGSSLHSSVAIDNTTAASYVYFRPSSGVPSDIHVVQNASGPSPAYLGVICTEGTTSDYAMTYDPADNSIYLFSTETVSGGAIYKLH